MWKPLMISFVSRARWNQKQILAFMCAVYDKNSLLLNNLLRWCLVFSVGDNTKGDTIFCEQVALS